MMDIIWSAQAKLAPLIRKSHFRNCKAWLCRMKAEAWLQHSKKHNEYELITMHKMAINMPTSGNVIRCVLTMCYDVVVM